MQKLRIAIDGASRGNPGAAGIGVVVYNQAGEVIREISEYIGETTNNVAEYTALIRGLEEGLSLGAASVRIQTDSELLARQMAGTYRVRSPRLQALHEKARLLLARFESAAVVCVPREENQPADKLASDAAGRRPAGRSPSAQRSLRFSRRSEEMDAIRSLLNSEQPVKWLFTGDSITHGVYYTLGQRDYVQIFEERVRGEMGRSRDLVIRTAVGGWTTELVYADIEWNILQFDPDVVSIMLGMNDACLLTLDDFGRHYRAILDAIAEKTHARAILHTPNPVVPGSDPSREASLPAIVERVRALGTERGLPVVDHWAEWQRAWQEDPGRIHTWMGDAIHPSVYGHRAFARLLLGELGIWDDSSPCCRFAVIT